MNTNELKLRISAIKETLSAHPKNNQKNSKLYLEKLESFYKEYSEKEKDVSNYLIRKHKNYLDINENKKIDELKAEVDDLEIKFDLFNAYNMSFEKLGLDKLLYDISKYYKGSLNRVNSDIKKVIDLFSAADINIYPNDFVYSSYAKEYMKVFLEESDNLSSEKLKKKFEEVYWQCPDIMFHIHLNLRYLYYKNISAFDVYVEGLQRNCLDDIKKGEKSYLNKYKAKFKVYHDMKESDQYLWLHKFRNKSLDINKYTKSEFKSKYKKYTSKDIDEHMIESLKKFYHSVLEYKNYLESLNIVNSVIEVYKTKDNKKELENSKSIFKKIKNLEDSLVKNSSNKKILGFIKTKKIDVNSIVLEIKELYLKLDEAIFREKVFEIINEDSSILEVLSLAEAYFIYIASILKKEDEDISDSEIYKRADKLNKFLIHPENNIISNLNAFKEYDIKMIISDKYLLDNLNTTMEMLSEDNLDSVLKEVEFILNYSNIEKLTTLRLEDINEFLKLDEFLK